MFKSLLLMIAVHCATSMESYAIDHSLNSRILNVYGGGAMSLINTISFVRSVDGEEDGKFVNCIFLFNSCDYGVVVVMKVSQGQKNLCFFFPLRFWL